jgi:hypothetical protein
MHLTGIEVVSGGLCGLCMVAIVVLLKKYSIVRHRALIACRVLRLWDPQQPYMTAAKFATRMVCLASYSSHRFGGQLCRGRSKLGDAKPKTLNNMSNLSNRAASATSCSASPATHTGIVPIHA